MSKIHKWNMRETHDRVIDILYSCGVIVSDTDTVLGLLAPTTQRGYDKLNEIKQRKDKPYLILISDKKKIAKFAQIPTPKVQQIIDRYWPGPLTIILPAQESLPVFMKSSDNTVALRMPDHKGMQAILTRYDGLFSTSANRAGEPIPSTIEQIDPALLKQVSLLVRDEKPQNSCVASTIIDATGDRIKIVRQGTMQIELSPP